MKQILLACFLLIPALLFAQHASVTIPAGTILPIQWNSTISSAKSKPGDKITARVMQDVPLPDGRKIRARTRVLGEVTEVVPSSGSAPGKITIRFDTLELGKASNVTIRTNLRAIASMLDVDDAQEPKFSPDYGTPAAAYPTVQIGGEAVYRGGGHVMHGSEIVGDPVPETGVLVTVRSRSGSPCRGETDGNTARQALWVFSSDACGAYDLPNLAIVHAGRSEPIGQIVLSAKHGDVKVAAGTGMLLRVNAGS